MKKLFALIMAVITVLSFAACGTDSQDSEKAELSSSPAPENAETAPSASPDTAEYTAAPIPESAETPSATSETVTYYHGDENAEKLIAENGEVPEISAQALLDLLYSKGVLSEPVVANSFNSDNGVLNLDVSGNFSALLSSMGTAGETIIMGSIVNTFLDAFNGNGMFITVDGETLVSGHNIYDYELEFFSN